MCWFELGENILQISVLVGTIKRNDSIALFIVNVCNGVSFNQIIPVEEDCFGMSFVRDGRRQALLPHALLASF